ncbi:unnamed protein product [Rodentolepis nana]|uniref:SprT-like domain-containing protein n=1 Tax=Rodentolepis nana TaxID=102285 RepID=A0A0R3TWG9_RODNA|nr:unnamed protein product [Rodentolepis nana]
MASNNPVYYPSNNVEQTKTVKRARSNDDFSCPALEISLVDPMWEAIDPTPDIRQLFIDFDTQFFGGKLKSVEIRWSKRMTLCAGVCSYEGIGGLCSIRLSEPLLKLRPRRDLVETLLHEMIHAYLFVTRNFRDRSDHGPKFQYHMKRINSCAGTNITIFHSFHDEVDNYRQHWWQCNGVCAKRPPFYGLLKRSTNRPPGPNDLWWSDHQASCNGQFIKVNEPADYKNKQKKSKVKNNFIDPTFRKSTSSLDIRKFVTTSSPLSSAGKVTNLSQPCSSKVYSLETQIASSSLSLSDCPVCGESFPLECMNDHLDNVHFI